MIPPEELGTEMINIPGSGSNTTVFCGGKAVCCDQIYYIQSTYLCRRTKKSQIVALTMNVQNVCSV